MISSEIHRLHFDQAVSDFMLDPKVKEMLRIFLQLSCPNLSDIRLVGEAFFAAGMVHATEEIRKMQREKIQ